MIGETTLSQEMLTYKLSDVSKSRKVDLEMNCCFKSGKLDLILESCAWIVRRTYENI